VTTFADGPAAGVRLVLGRAPWLLRVVRSAAGEWDALDQLGDTPRPGETISVYYRASDVLRYHVLMVKRSQSGWRESADYKLLSEQPPESVVRDTAAWQKWCQHEGRQAMLATHKLTALEQQAQAALANVKALEGSDE
jgi:hypothetical protein